MSWRSLGTVLSLVPLLWGGLAAGAPEPPAADGEKGALFEEEKDAVVERIRLYLQRHGEGGRIDPARRLKQVTAVHRELVARRERGLETAAAGPAWMSLGPTNGAGRMVSLASHPTATGTVYAGAAGGGVWKTTDGGGTWVPLTETISDLSVGAVALPPSAPGTVYVGTGEGGYAQDFIPGIGFLKSTDGGASWTLPASVVASMFYRFSVHPTHPDELLAGTNRGMLRSTDGGASWSTTIDPSAGDVVEVVRHPANPSVVWAGVWCKEACSASSMLVQKSTDGGAGWAASSTGLPAPASLESPYHTRPALAVSQSNPQVLYLSTAIWDATDQVDVSHVYKTTDGGETWADLPGVSASTSTGVSRFLGSQSWYDNVLVVSPSDSNTVFAGGVGYVRTTDGGSTWRVPFTSTIPHADAHDLTYQGSTLWIASDGGVWTSTDGGGTFAERNDGLVTRQYYALAIDPVNPSRILGGAQDNGTNQRLFPGTTWRTVVGGDGFECAVHPLVPEVAYGTYQGTRVVRTKEAGAISTPAFSLIGPPFPAGEVGPFLSLLTIDPSSPHTLYAVSHRVWKSTDGGDSWLPLPMTTSDGKAWPNGGTITAVARSRANPSLVMISWAQAGRVLGSIDGGSTWRTISAGLPTDFVINHLEIDPRNASVAYASLASQTVPNVYRTTDGGTSWHPRSSGLPAFAAQVVRVDPNDSNVLYCGTDVGVYQSTDQGASWWRFGTGLPASSVHDLRISEDRTLIRLATHGRGIWELQLPPASNHAPVATMTAPVSAPTVGRGATVVFEGTAIDPDGGDATETSWTVTDVWKSFAAPAGTSSFVHLFSRSGIFPVSLSARDASGARGASVVTVTVTDPADSCSTPAVIPGDGPFPYTISIPDEAATSQDTDPLSSCSPYAPYRGLWFEFTPAATDSYEISTCGATVDTVLSVWRGSVCGPYTALASGCNNDAPVGSSCAGSAGSLLTLPLTGGATYRILASSYLPSQVGMVPLTVTPTSSAPAPRITFLTPWEGPDTGGTTVTIHGFGFMDGATVSFGGTSMEATSVSSTMLTAKTPAHAAGTVDVAVRNPDSSTGIGAGAFTFSPASAYVATCAPDAVSLCLLGNRFRVTADYADYGGGHGQGLAEPVTSDAGYFWFFDAKNVEVTVKMVSFCGGGSNNVSVYAGGLTDLEVILHVTDVWTGVTKDYRNPLGTGFQLVRDGPFVCP